MMLKFFALLLLLPTLAHANFKVCGKFMECGVFSGTDIFDDGEGARTHIRIFEFTPGVITLLSIGSDKITDWVPIRFKFDGEDGHFFIYYMGFMDVGEGSCSNMICQFKADDSRWPYAEGRPPVQLSGTLSFANGQISRIELRKLEGETPLFVTGVLSNLCSTPELRNKLSLSGKITEESCFYFMQNKTSQALKGVLGGTGPKSEEIRN